MLMFCYLSSSRNEGDNLQKLPAIVNNILMTVEQSIINKIEWAAVSFR